jgi:hypothetical protein
MELWKQQSRGSQDWGWISCVYLVPPDLSHPIIQDPLTISQYNSPADIYIFRPPLNRMPATPSINTADA